MRWFFLGIMAPGFHLYKAESADQTDHQN